MTSRGSDYYMQSVLHTSFCRQRHCVAPFNFRPKPYFANTCSFAVSPTSGVKGSPCVTCQRQLAQGLLAGRASAPSTALPECCQPPALLISALVPQHHSSCPACHATLTWLTTAWVINQRFSQAFKQSINQTINQSFEQSINHANNH